MPAAAEPNRVVILTTWTSPRAGNKACLWRRDGKSIRNQLPERTPPKSKFLSSRGRLALPRAPDEVDDEDPGFDRARQESRNRGDERQATVLFKDTLHFLPTAFLPRNAFSICNSVRSDGFPRNVFQSIGDRRFPYQPTTMAAAKAVPSKGRRNFSGPKAAGRISLAAQSKELN